MSVFKIREGIQNTNTPVDHAQQINLVILYQADIYLFKVYNGNDETMCEIYSKLTIKTPFNRQYLLDTIYDYLMQLLLILKKSYTLF